jgi:hypothetical protein
MADDGDQKKRRYLTPKQVSEKFGGTPAVQTLANWRANTGGGPPFIRIGNRVLYPSDMLDAWVLKHTDNRGTPAP